MAHKGPKGLKCRSTTITKFWLLPFLLAFRRRGFSLGLSLRLVNRSFSMKDSDMTLEWIVFTNGFLAQWALHITLLRSVRYNKVTRYVAEESSIAQITLASLKKINDLLDWFTLFQLIVDWDWLRKKFLLYPITHAKENKNERDFAPWSQVHNLATCNHKFAIWQLGNLATWQFGNLAT